VALKDPTKTDSPPIYDGILFKSSVNIAISESLDPNILRSLILADPIIAKLSSTIMHFECTYIISV